MKVQHLMHEILITGFTPFDGRAVNASWIAASALARLGEFHGHRLRALQIPVCWGAPRRALTQALQAGGPALILSMGEGEPGIFRLETLARNVRRERPDNDGRLPAGEPICAQGPAERRSSFACQALSDALTAQGIPARLSDDAGAYLCEELLYTLEEFKEAEPAIGKVLFVHVPPYGSALQWRGAPRLCDESLLLEFGESVLTAILPQP
jgi:pyroglutamyl-peptidase